MNIGLLLHPYGEKSPGGLGRSVYEITHALLSRDTQNVYRLYFKDTNAPRPSFPGTQWTYRGLGSRLLWLTGAFHMSRTLDVYVFFTPIIPFFLRPKRSVVLALDFAYWRMRGSSLRDRASSRLLFYLHGRALRCATAIVAISEETKRDVVELFSIAPDRIRVVPLSSVPLGEEKKELPVPEHFFLFAGVLKERKNVAGIIRAFALFANGNATHHLLIAGKRGGTYDASLRVLVQELGLATRIRFLGYVSNAELAYLYGRAEALVFPSFIEGFGMPVLEAMHAGLPVITSHTGALAEIAEGAALLVDPADPASIATAMSTIADDPTLRAELVQKGYARAAEFSWGKAAGEILEIITSVAHTDPTP